MCSREKNPPKTSDNSFIISGSLDNTVKVWDLASGKLVYTILSLPGSQFLVLQGNKFMAPGPALGRLYYSDRLARYPAADLPELRIPPGKPLINTE